MKIAYIILPFGSSEYLIRCINSIYRQSVDRSRYYVIIAENSFGAAAEKTEGYLSENKDIIRIPDDITETNEKITAAVSLIPQDADRVIFTDVDTVYAVSAFSELEKYEDSDIIIANSVVKKKDSFEKTEYNEETAYSVTAEWEISDTVLSADILKKAEADKLCDNAYLHIFILEEILFGGSRAAVCDDICMYKTKAPEKVSGAALMNYSNKLSVIFEKIISQAEGQNKIKAYEEYMSLFMNYLTCGDELSEEIKTQAFEMIKSLSVIIKNDRILNKLNKLNTGCTAEEIAEMDYFSYVKFMELGSRYNDKAAETVIRTTISGCMAEQKKNIDKLNAQIDALLRENESYKKITDELCRESRNIKDQLDEVKKKDSAAFEETEKLRNDIAALNKNIHFLSQSVEDIKNKAPAVISDPVITVPQIFASGRAGFSVILKSISAWLKYKFGKKS